MQPALLLAPPSATLSWSLLLFLSTTGTGLGGVSVTLYRFLFLLSGANCTGLSSASATLSGFFFWRFGATGTWLMSTSSARCSCDRQAGSGQKSCEAQPCQNFLEFSNVHAVAPSSCWLVLIGFPSSQPVNHAKGRNHRCQGNGVSSASCSVDEVFRLGTDD